MAATLTLRFEDRLQNNVMADLIRHLFFTENARITNS